MAYALKPVNYDPFTEDRVRPESENKAVRLTPVDYDPFETKTEEPQRVGIKEPDKPSLSVGRLAGRAVAEVKGGIGDSLKGRAAYYRHTPAQNIPMMPGSTAMMMGSGEAELMNEAYWGGGRKEALAEDYQAAGDKEIFQRDEKYNESSGFIEDVVGGVSGFLPSMGLQAVNPAAGTIQMYHQLVGSQYDHMVKQGVDKDRAFIAASLSSLAQVPLESAGNVITLGALKKIATGRVSQFLLGLTQSMTGEGLEEYLQSYPEEIANIYAANPDVEPDYLIGAVKDRLTSKEFQKESAYQAAVGAGGGALMVSTGQAVKSAHDLTTFMTQKQKQVNQKKVADKKKSAPVDLLNEEINDLIDQEITAEVEEPIRSKVPITPEETANAAKPVMLGVRAPSEYFGESAENAAQTFEEQPSQSTAADSAQVFEQEGDAITRAARERQGIIDRTYLPAEQELDEINARKSEPVQLGVRPGQLPESVQPETPQEATETIEAKDDIPVTPAEKIDLEANEAATSPLNDIQEPTQAQKEAGNYRKGHIKFQGMDIAIENPEGSERSGKDESGKSWSVTLNHHYGYFKRTDGKDGDQIDVIVGPDTESQKVHVVDQINPETGKFDEHKVLVGFKNKISARKAYLSNYEKGWKGLGEITEMPMDEFKKWKGDGTRKTKPVASSLIVPGTGEVTKTATEPGKTKTEDKKEPWQIPKAEYLGDETDEYTLSIRRAAHANHVKKAVKEGKDVPLNVLEAYKLNNWAMNAIKAKIKADTPTHTDSDMPTDLKLDKKGWYLNADDRPIWVTRKFATENGWRGPWTKTEVAELTGTHADYLKKDGKPVLPSEMRRGKVGGKLSSGEVVLTVTGRQTSPFPKLSFGPRATTKTVNAVDHWLLSEAVKEARSRGDEFNQRSFGHDAEIKGAIPQASKDAAEEYLFGDFIPPVPQKITRPLVSKPAKNIKDELDSMSMDDVESMLDDVIAEKEGEAESKEEIFTIDPLPPGWKKHGSSYGKKIIYHNNSGYYVNVVLNDNGYYHVSYDRAFVGKASSNHAIVEGATRAMMNNRVIDFMRKHKAKTEPAKTAQPKLKEGDSVRYVPDSEYADPVEGIVRDIIKNQSGETGYNIFSPTENDKYRTVRVWESKGKFEKTGPAPEQISDEKKAGKRTLVTGKKVEPRKRVPADWKTIPGAGGSIKSNFGNYIIGGKPGEFRLTNQDNGNQIGGTYTDRDTAARAASNHYVKNQPSEATKPIEQSASDILKKAAKEGVTGLDEVTKGLHDLFGGSSLKSFPGGIDEDTYAKAKPHFQAGFQSFAEAGKSMKDFVRWVVDSFGANVKPYLMKWVGEKKDKGLTKGEKKPIIKENEGGDNEPASQQVVDDQGRASSGLSATGDNAAVSEPNPLPKSGKDSGKSSGPEPGSEKGGARQGSEGRDSDEHDRTDRGGTSGKVAGGPGISDSGVVGESNHVIQPDDILVVSGPESKIRANIKAIQLLKILTTENRNATPDEKKILAQYVGWGAFSQKVFNREFTDYLKSDTHSSLENYFYRDDGKAYKNWAKKYGKKLHPELGGLMTQEEWDSARASTVNAHYTSRPVINSMWSLVKQLGFKGGSVLEPAAGVGHFFGLMPQDIAKNSVLFGVEKDTISGEILKKLYPDANIQISPFEKTKAIDDNSMDLVITNVPFGNFSILDKKHPDYSGWSIHNYFFGRSLTATKPGGIVMAITSSWSMDAKSNGKIREYLADKADLIGAIRLPNTAFAESAGTDVVTDIIVLRKKDSGVSSGHDFRLSNTLETKESIKLEKDLAAAIGKRDRLQALPQIKKRTKLIKQSIAAAKAEASELLAGMSKLYGINEYFAKNPEMVLGKHSMKGTMYASETYTLDPTGKIEDQLRDAITFFPKNIAGEGTDISRIKPVKYSQLDDKEGTIISKDGKLYSVENARLVEPYYLDSKGKKQVISGLRMKRLERYLKIRDLTTKLFDVMAKTESTDAEIEKLQSSLSVLYDKFAKTYQAFGAPGNSFLRKADNNYAIVDALEVENEDVPGTFDKAPIFTKRTIFPFVEPTSANNIEDASNLSLVYRGRLDAKYIADLIGTNNLDAVKSELVDKGLAFIEPETGLMIQRDEYLSGAVKKKLKAAKLAVEDNPTYKKNIKALEPIIPEDMDIGFIEYRLGSAWLPADSIKEFIQEVLDVEADVSFARSDSGSRWSVVTKTNAGNVKNRNTFGTPEYTGTSLIEMALNMQRARIMVSVTENGSKRTYEDKDATKENNLKIQEINNEFITWSKSHGEWAKKLQDAYNEEKNGFVLRKHSAPVFYDANGKETLSYPNASTAITLRTPQRVAVSRGLQESVLLAYGVGTGKTYIYITLAMEMRRIGTAKKPVIVVHNQTIDQYRKSFKTLYPQAKVLIPNYQQRTSAMRKRTLVSMATGDWDAIVLPQSFFDGIANDPERERAFVEEQLQQIEDQISDAIAEEGRSLRVKEMEKMLEKRKQRLESLLERRKDEAVLFEQMGVDALLIDEVHNYKRSEFYTKLNRVKGIDNGSSQRSTSLILKSGWIRSKTGGKNIVTATGTPISNTMAELWTMLRYVRPDILEDYGVSTFDDFAGAFGDVVEGIEETASGFKMVERFARYVNGPELLTMFFTGADVMLTKDADLKLPKIKGGKPTGVISEKSPELTSYIKGIIDQWRAWEALPGREKRKQRHVPLVLYGRAKKAAVDLRLIDPDYYKDDPSSKLSKVSENVYEIYKDTKDNKSTQIVFLDIFRDSAKNPKFNAHKEIKRKLIAKGVKPEEIAIFSDAGTNEKKQTKMKDGVRSGDIRVIIGSSAKLGVGIDIADKMIAAHHVNVPDRPMDIEQRDGRIIRQGNENEEVQIFHYCTKDSLDSVMFGRLLKKQRYADQILAGDIEGRTFSDPFSMEQASFAEFAAASSGEAGKLLFEKNELLAAENKYLVAQTAHTRRVSNARSRLRELPTEIDNLEKQLDDSETLKKHVEKEFPETKIETASYRGEVLDKKKFLEKLQKDIDKIIKDWKGKYEGKPFGDYDKETGNRLSGQLPSVISGGIEVGLRLSANTNYSSWAKPSEKIHFLDDQSMGAADLDMSFSLAGSKDSIGWKQANAQNINSTFTRSFNGILRDIVSKPNNVKKNLEDANKEEAEFNNIATEQYKYRDELNATQRRLADIDRELVALSREEGDAAPVAIIDEDGEEIETSTDLVKEAETKPKYYRNTYGKGFTVAENAEPVEIVPWAETFVYEDEEGDWHVIEKTSGLSVTPQVGVADKADAIRTATDRILQAGEKQFKEVVANGIGKVGQAPGASIIGNERGSIPVHLKPLRDILTSETPSNTVIDKKRDMGKRERQTRPPQWLAKRHKEFKEMFDRMNQRVKDRTRMLSESIEETADFYSMKKSSEEFDQLKNLIWSLEGKHIKELSKKFRKNDDGEYFLNEMHYEEYRDWLDKLPSLSESVKEKYIDIRISLDKDLATVMNSMNEMDDIDETVLEEFRKSMGNIHNYFPHMRYGKHYFQAYNFSMEKDGDAWKAVLNGKTLASGKNREAVFNKAEHHDDSEILYREHFDSKTGQKRKAMAKINRLIENGDIPDNVSFRIGEVTRMPEDVFAIPVPIEAIEAVMNAAIDRLDSEEAKSSFRTLLPQAVSDALKSRGWGSHTIKRKGIPGHETEDVQRVLFDYKAGLYGWITKMQTARDFSQMMAKIQSSRKPQLWAAMRRYAYDMLENADQIDRIVNNLKAVFFAKYLGGNVKTAVLNTTQNIIAGWPRLGMEMGSAFGRVLKGANADIVSHLSGKKNLSYDELKLLTEMFEEGTTGSQFLTEVRSQIGDNVFSVGNKYIMRGLGLPMEIAERFNRVSLAIAAYRGATKGKINNSKTLKEFGMGKGESFSYEQAKEFATTIVEDSHFIYGKANRPEALRGGSLNKLLLSAYTFRSFTHHLINLWTWMFSQGGRGKIAVAKSIAGSIAIGGITSIPLYKTFMNIVRQLTGDDPEEDIIDALPEGADMLRDMLIYGIPSISGFTLGGSIGMELPVFERLKLNGSLTGQLGDNMGEIVGIPWAAMEDIESSITSYRSGQRLRALEYIAPAGVSNVLKGYRMGTKGSFTLSGRPINVPGSEGPQRLSTKESIGKAIGFQPIKLTKSWDINQRLQDFQTFKTDKRGQFASRILNAGDNKTRLEILEEVDEWNQSNQDRPEYVITPDELVSSIVARTKTRKPPKYLFGKTKELREQYLSKETP